MPDVTIDVADVPDANRFEAYADGELAGFLDYRRTDGRVAYVHTEALPGHEGQGIGTALARYAMDAARANGETVDPQCSFVAAWVRHHAEYADLVQA